MEQLPEQAALLSQAGTIEPWLERTFRCLCGAEHKVPIRRIAIERGALAGVGPYLQETGRKKAAIVADRHTMQAAGEKLTQLLRSGGVDVTAVVLQGGRDGELAADEQSIVEALLGIPLDAEAVIAVGSGTLHDIVRFVCHRTGRAFVSVPTAASVDGFASVGAPLILRGFKLTVPATAPEAIFADLDVLMLAPQSMTAAGFGDMLGKYTSLADWELGRLLLGEAYCPLAVEMTRQALNLCVSHTDDIARSTELGIRKLTEGLLLSGISMLIVGHSRPASGSEHHLSHYWEMRFLQEGRRALLHGAKVGAACVMMAGLYARVGSLTAEEAALRIAAMATPPSQQADTTVIRQYYGEIADSVVRENFPQPEAVSLTASGLERALNRWDDVRQVAAQVPAPEQLAAWLSQAGGPTTPAALGVEASLTAESLQAAMFVRNRYSIMRLAGPLGLLD